jgi:protein-S-isoprenylcysteine O-methyltransferase Ste14
MHQLYGNSNLFQQSVKHALNSVRSPLPESVESAVQNTVLGSGYRCFALCCARAEVTVRLLLKLILLAILWTGIFVGFGWLISAPSARLTSIRSSTQTFLLLLVVVAGVVLCLWSTFGFALRGLGTPAPFDPPRRLVVVGPYRYVRNPMYIAALLVLLGQAALFGAPQLVPYAAVFALAAHAFVVGYEERTLARRFGADYAAYRAAVGRWLPRLTPYEHRAPAG